MINIGEEFKKHRQRFIETLSECQEIWNHPPWNDKSEDSSNRTYGGRKIVFSTTVPSGTDKTWTRKGVNRADAQRWRHRTINIWMGRSSRFEAEQMQNATLLYRLPTPKGNEYTRLVLDSQNERMNCLLWNRTRISHREPQQRIWADRHWQIEIHDKDSQKAGFLTHHGLF